MRSAQRSGDRASAPLDHADEAPAKPFDLPSGVAAHYGVQRKAVGRIESDPDAAFAAATRGAGSEVPYRGEMERAFAQSFAGVRTYHGAQGLESIGARAAARDEKVAFDTPSPDKALVAHELTHIVQQRQSPASAPQRKSSVSEAGEAAEREADQVAAQVTRGEQVTVREAPPAALPLGRGTLKTPRTVEGTKLEVGQEVEVVEANFFMVTILVDGKRQQIPSYEITITDRSGLGGGTTTNVNPMISLVQPTGEKKTEEKKTEEKKTEEPPVEGAEPNPGALNFRHQYRTVQNPLFGEGGPMPQDALQGGIGDCFFISALDALARTEMGKAQIRSMIQVTDEGRAFQVTLYAQAQERKEWNKRHDQPNTGYGGAFIPIKVTNDFPMNNANFAYAMNGKDGQAPLWPAVLEKAYAALKGSYGIIDHGDTLTAAVVALTGKQGNTIGVGNFNGFSGKLRTEEEILKEVAAELDHGRPLMTCWNNHAYSLVSVCAGEGGPLAHTPGSLEGLNVNDSYWTVRDPNIPISGNEYEVVNQQTLGERRARPRQSDKLLRMSWKLFAETFEFVGRFPLK